MEREEAFRIVTRGLAAVSTLFFICTVINLPVDILSLVHYLHRFSTVRQMGDSVPSDTYLVRSYALRVIQLSVGSFLFLFISRWCYRGSTSLRRYFLE